MLAEGVVRELKDKVQTWFEEDCKDFGLRYLNLQVCYFFNGVYDERHVKMVERAFERKLCFRDSLIRNSELVSKIRKLGVECGILGYLGPDQQAFDVIVRCIDGEITVTVND